MNSKPSNEPVWNCLSGNKCYHIYIPECWRVF